MRESNFNFPAQNRASVCISSALYDRRAIDAPSPSLPLVNSLTHLSYLTATSPRIREILSLDGGLERLVRILKGCATGGPESIDENLSQLKGKGKTLAKGSRRSPFKAFSEYRQPSSTPSPLYQKSALSSPAISFDDGAPFPSFPPSYTAHPSPPPSPPPPASEKSKQLLYTYTLAFQCVVNIGVRGSEMIRTRVVEAGALDVVVHVLERYLDRSTPARATPDPVVPASRHALDESREVGDLLAPPPARVATPDTVASMDDGVADDTTSSSGHEDDEAASTTRRPRRAHSRSKLGREAGVDHDGDVAMDGGDADPGHLRSPSRSSSTSTVSLHAADGVLQYRDEDVLLSLQLLAYLSKYPHVRSVFHSPSDVESDTDDHNHGDCGDFCTSVKTPRSHASASSTKPPLPSAPTAPTLSSNVFSLVEAFTHRPPASDKYTPRHSTAVQYWAGVIMRNACRKDENKGGIRQCANMQCGVWEKTAREFAKCRRCRKAKYCSKSCQSKAWQFGHRYWCTKATPREDGEGDCDGDEGAPRMRSGRHRGEGRGGREHHGPPRPGTAHSFDDDDDDQDDLPPPASAPSDPAGRAMRHRHSNPHDLPLDLDLGRGHHHQHAIVGVAGMGVRVGPDDMDEHEVAQEMMGGGVFGEMGAGGVGVDA